MQRNDAVFKVVLYIMEMLEILQKYRITETVISSGGYDMLWT